MQTNTIGAMLRWSRKKMQQRKHKPMAKHACETIAASGVGFDERRDDEQTGPCARAHVKPTNSYADLACCDSEPTPDTIIDKRG